MTDTREHPSQVVSDDLIPPGRGLRVRPQRPVRAVLALLLVVASVVAALTVYTRIGDRSDVLVATRTVLAGEQTSDTDFRVVSISTEDDLATVSADDRPLLVGQYAKVRIEAGAVLTSSELQPDPLVSIERVLMSVLVPAGEVPVGLREQSRVVLVVAGGTTTSPTLVEATVAAIPSNLSTVLADTTGVRSQSIPLSVEVAPEFVSLVGSANEVSLGVLDPAAPVPGAQFVVSDTAAEDLGDAGTGADAANAATDSNTNDPDADSNTDGDAPNGATSDDDRANEDPADDDSGADRADAATTNNAAGDEVDQ